MAAENHAKIVRSFWADPDIKTLTREEAHLLLYFFTSRHGNMIGLYCLPIAYAAAEAKFTPEDVRRAIAGPLAAFVTYDAVTEEIFVHSAAKHQIGEELRVSEGGKEDNRIEGVRKLVRAIHSIRLQRAFLQRYNSAFSLQMPLPDAREGASKGLSKGASKGLRRGSKKPLARGSAEAPYQAPSKPEAVADTETDTETENIPAAAATGSAPAARLGWPAEFAQRFEAIGLFAPSRVVKAVAPVVERYGIERARDMLAAFVNLGPYQKANGEFDRSVQAHHFCTPERFRDTAGFWFAHTEPLGGNGATAAH